MKRFNEVTRRSQVLAVTAVLALGLSATSVLPAQAEDGVGSTVSGTVTIAANAESSAVPFAGTKVCDGGADSANCVLTDAAGNYTLTNVLGWGGNNSFYPTAYPATAAQAALFRSADYGSPRAPHYLFLTAGSTLTGIDIRVLANADVTAGDTVKASAPLTASGVKMVGKAKVGATLRLKAGHWTSAAPVKLHYQWYRNGHRIAGATKKAYRVTAKDRHKRIQVRVIGKSGHKSLAVRTVAKRVR